MLSDRPDLLTSESPARSQLLDNIKFTMNLAIPKPSVRTQTFSLVQAQLFSFSQDPVFMDFIRPLATRVGLQRVDSYLLCIYPNLCYFSKVSVYAT